MAGSNSAGKPNTNNYNLGRGAVYFADLDTTNQLPQAYRHLGNAPEFNINVEVETLEHQSSLEGLKTVDKEVTISQKIGLSLSLDEVQDFDNLSVFMSGDVATHANPTTVSGQEILLNNGITGAASSGRWFDIYDENGDRIYDIQNAADVDLEDGTTPLTLNTEYELDLVMGRVFILEAYNSGNGLSTNLNLADINPNTGAETTIDEVRGLTKTSVSGALKFIGKNPANGDEQVEYQFHKVALKAEGDFGLISDDYTVMQFTGVAEKNETGSPDSPTLTIRSWNQAA